jgi:urease accessory protein UreF
MQDEKEVYLLLVLRDEVYPELEDEQLPATTWPLEEILSAPHDLLHSRIFNS